MRLHFSSASTLALATAATLALPLSASAADYVVRNGQKIAASLEAPAEQPIAASAALAANPHVQVNNGETITNNEDLISGIVNNGTLVNNGKITYFDVNSGAFGVSNQSGDVGRLRNFGTTLNTGKIFNVKNRDGNFTNGQGGSVTNLDHYSGVASNQGTITEADVLGGTLTNNTGGLIKTVKISRRVFNNGIYTEAAATLNNTGKIENANVSKLGTLNNNQGGSIDTLTNAGTVFNEGQIGTVTQTAGNLTNNGTILGNTLLEGGILTNKKSMGTVEVKAGTNFLNVGGTVKSLTNNGISTNSGSILNVIQQGGTFTNDAAGNVHGLTQEAGVSTNDGKITIVNVKAGTFTNNGSGVIDQTTMAGGALLNSGRIANIAVLATGTLTNNKTGIIGSLNNDGSASNAGFIENVIMGAGNLANAASGTIDTLLQSAGITTNNGSINSATIVSGTLTNNGTGIIATAKMINGTIVNNGAITVLEVQEKGTLTNNLSGTIDTLKNGGIVSNGGQIGTVSQTAGSFVNNGTILGEALIEGGALTNNKALGSATIAVGASFVNNENGISRGLINFGTAISDGSIRHIDQKGGTLVNQAKGTIAGLEQSGGVTTNNGTIERAKIDGGTLVNNNDAKIGDTVVTAGTLQNSGAIQTIGIAAEGTFANNASGKIDRVSSLGKGSNGGNIVNLQVMGGEFNNSGVVSENVNVDGGTFTSSGLIGGLLNVKAGSSNLSGIVNGGVLNGVNGSINIRGNVAGKGDFINNGSMGTSSKAAISGFDNFLNDGTLLVKGDLDIGGNVISSGKIGMSGDLTQFETLKAGGNLTLTSKSETSLNIAENGDHDTLAAVGDVTLGGTLNVSATGDKYALKSTYETFTSTAGAVVGRFTDVIVSGATSLFGTVEASTKGLVLAIRNRDVLNTQLEKLNLGENGKILTGLTYANKDGAELFDTLAAVKAEDAPGLIAQITGAATSAVVNVGNSAAKGFGSLMQKVATASGMRRSDAGILAYEKARKAGELTAFEPVLEQGQGAVGFWARGFGETGSSNGSGNSSLGGVGAGVEVAMGQNLTVGASLGHSMAKFGKSKAIEGKTNSFHGGGYLAMGATAPESTGFGLTASGSYSKHDTHSQRSFNVGALTKIATANYGGTTIAGEVMVRNGFTIGDKVPLTIAPIAGLKFAMDTDEGYTETGAGALNLTVSGSKRSSLVGVVGLQLASRIETESMVFTPHVSAAYQHEFLDTSSTTTRTLAGSPTPFTVKQGGGSRSSVALEAGLGMRFAGGLAVDVSGYGVISPDEKRYGATVTLKAGF